MHYYTYHFNRVTVLRDINFKIKKKHNKVLKKFRGITTEGIYIYTLYILSK